MYIISYQGRSYGEVCGGNCPSINSCGHPYVLCVINYYISILCIFRVCTIYVGNTVYTINLTRKLF